MDNLGLVNAAEIDKNSSFLCFPNSAKISRGGAKDFFLWNFWSRIRQGGRHHHGRKSGFFRGGSFNNGTACIIRSYVRLGRSLHGTCGVLFRNKLINDFSWLYESELLPDDFLQIGHIGLKKVTLVRKTLDLPIDLTDLLIQTVRFRFQLAIAGDRRKIDPAKDQNDRKCDPENRKEFLQHRALSLGPAYTAFEPRASSILSKRLYLQMRSVREVEPVLICPVLRATARSAIVVSSVSPLR